MTSYAYARAQLLNNLHIPHHLRGDTVAVPRRVLEHWVEMHEGGALLGVPPAIRHFAEEPHRPRVGIDEAGIDALAFKLANEMTTWSREYWENPEGADFYRKEDYLRTARQHIETYFGASS